VALVSQLHLTASGGSALNKLYDQYGDRVAFLVVYIWKASQDVWQMQSNVKTSRVGESAK